MDPSDNPFELAPELQPALFDAADVIRHVFGARGLDLTRLVIVVELDDEAFGGPFRTAVSWPMNEPDMGAGLAAEGAEVLRSSAAARRARGHG